jgi:polysaccharide export outer membrane protein
MNYCQSKFRKTRNKGFFVSIVAATVMVMLLGSCGINSSLMYKAPTNYVYDSLIKVPTEQYKIAVNDRLKITFFKQKGEKILDMMSGTVGTTVGNNQGAGITYVVRQDSTAEFPLIGAVNVVGMTTNKCKDTLVKLLMVDYKEPFVQLEVINKRVFVFPGNGGEAKVVSLLNENTTLMEALVLAGGITDRGKAKSIRVMRKEQNEWKVFKIDLSKIEGLEDSDMIVQANDYIYVDPNPRIAREVLEEIAPIVSIISSAALIVTIITNYAK